jgi:hypothetical protein
MAKITQNYIPVNKTLLILFLSVLSFAAHSQIQMGFKLSPVISGNRVDIETDDVSVDSDGSAVRFSFGPIADFSLDANENYYFSTGFWLTSKRAGISYSDGVDRITQSYNLQYIQLPATLKFYTNEVGLDKRIFFQFGPTFDIKVSEKLKDGDRSQKVIEDFRFFDMTLYMSAALEYQLGQTTRIFGGISYSRGLINAASDAINDDIIYKNDYFGIELGVMF